MSETQMTVLRDSCSIEDDQVVSVQRCMEDPQLPLRVKGAVLAHAVALIDR